MRSAWLGRSDPGYGFMAADGKLEVFAQQHPRKARGLRAVLLIVLVVSTSINALAFSASQLWVSPDASYYVELAGGITDRLDFTSELFLVRPPGYPLLLAALFFLFGASSATAILVAQHVMVVAIAVVAALIGWHLTANRVVTLAVGLMAACSLQLLAFANVIIAEVPYTLAMMLAVYFLVRYHLDGRWRFLLLASLMVGVSHQFRPIGLVIVATCAAAAWHRAWSSYAGPTCNGLLGALVSRFRSSRCRRQAAGGLVAAIAPAGCVVLPMAVVNMVVHDAGLSGPCANLALYHRLASMDDLDSTRSEALADIKSVVAEAIDTGRLRPGADYRHWGPVWTAYEAVRGQPLVKSGAVMAQATRDLLREYPLEILDRTLRYGLWTVMVPDAFYRFHAGGTPGTTSETGERNRAENAEIFDSATYEPMLERWLDPYEHYLTLKHEASATTPAWAGTARWFYRNIENGPPIPGLGDSTYESLTWLCLLGMCGSLMLRRRATWALVASVVVLQVAASAFLAGPTPRYAVPLKPLLLLFGVILPLVVTRLVCLVRVRRSAEINRASGGAGRYATTAESL